LITFAPSLRDMPSVERFSGRYFVLCVVVYFGAAAPSTLAVDLIGYVPYYQMGTSYNNNTLPAQLGMLNEVRYFGLTVGSDGSLIPHSGTLQSHKNNIALIKQKIDLLPPAQRPRLDITFGGFGESSNFPAIAANAALRATFAQNINALLNETGATAVDIDWENPTSAQYNNYTALLHRIKQEVGAARRVYATVEPQITISPLVLENTDQQTINGIDGISLMTYELAWWGNDSTHRSRGEHSLPQYAVDTVDAWTQPAGSTNRRPYVWAFGTWGQNASAGDLGIGLPFFGRTVNANPPPPTNPVAYTYSQLVAGGTPDASGNCYTYAGQTVWTAGPGLAVDRVKSANDRGLQHIIIWELGQDLAPTNTNSLLRTAFLKNQTLGGDFDGDRAVDTTDFNIWRTTFGLTSDLRADGNGNGVVDAGDYVVWRSHATAAGSGAAINGAVPEPATVTSILVLAFLLMAGGRRTGLRR